MLRRGLVPGTLGLALTTASSVACTAGISPGEGGGGSGATASVSTVSGSSTASDSSSTTGVGGGCVGTKSKADPIPLDVFVMLDQSGSMSQGAGNGISKWETVKAAIGQFVSEPAANGIGMGIQYFGLPQYSVSGCMQQPCATDGDCMNGCTTCLPQGVCGSPYNPDVDSCEAIDYAWADVPIETLPGAGPAIVGSLGMHLPGTNTPTSPALAGAIMYATSWATSHPDHVTVVAFATDGDPSECDTDLGNIDAIASAGVAGSPSIRTFVIGVGGSTLALDGIAAAGGTTAAYHVDFDPDATSLFVQTMNQIRGAAIQCTYEIPPPPEGMEENFDLVNVSYAPGGGGADQAFPHVDGLASCPATGDGWYYDDPTMPHHVVLCPATCAKVDADTMAEVDVVFGCKTIVP